MRFLDAIVPKRIVYLLDVSGSVCHEQRRVMQNELERSVAQLDAGQQYQVVLFDHETYYQHPPHYITIEPIHIKPHIDLLRNGYGGSDVVGAIKSVLKTYPDVDVILVATDEHYSEGYAWDNRIVFATLPRI